MNNVFNVAGVPKTVFSVIAGLWMGYYATRFYHQNYFGKFKYSYEYALSRKKDFPMAGKLECLVLEKWCS